MTNISDTLAALNPCRWCGSKCGRISYVGSYASAKVTCGNCLAHGPAKRTKAEAIAAWNTRTGQLVPVPSVERVAAALHSELSRIDVMRYLDMPDDAAERLANTVIAAMQEGRDG